MSYIEYSVFPKDIWYEIFKFMDRKALIEFQTISKAFAFYVDVLKLTKLIFIQRETNFFYKRKCANSFLETSTNIDEIRDKNLTLGYEYDQLNNGDLFHYHNEANPFMLLDGKLIDFNCEEARIWCTKMILFEVVHFNYWSGYWINAIFDHHPYMDQIIRGIKFDNNDGWLNVYGEINLVNSKYSFGLGIPWKDLLAKVNVSYRYNEDLCQRLLKAIIIILKKLPLLTGILKQDSFLLTKFGTPLTELTHWYNYRDSRILYMHD